MFSLGELQELADLAELTTDRGMLRVCAGFGALHQLGRSPGEREAVTEELREVIAHRGAEVVLLSRYPHPFGQSGPDQFTRRGADRRSARLENLRQFG